MAGSVKETGSGKGGSAAVAANGSSSTNGQTAKADDAAKGKDKQEYAKPNFRRWDPHVWIGSNFGALWDILWRHRFNVGYKYIHVVFIDLVIAAGHSFLGRVQKLTHGRKIEETKVEHPPLFIIGHWRSGTTLLHELLVLDEQHTYPTTYECFCPHHVLLTSGIGGKLLKFLVPPKRPMDNMALGWDRPQEDEFALCSMGIPTPYRTIAFPNHPPECPEYLDFQGVSEEDQAHWKRGWMWFVKMLTCKDPRRLVLKSPPHTSRLKVLLELFPDARFVYLVRNPYVVFPSTVHLWKSLYEAHGYQDPTGEGIEEYVLDNFARMHKEFEATRDLVPEGNLTVLKYEDLVANPIENMRDIYEQLQLGDFQTVLPAIEQYFADAADYKTNRYRKLDPEIRKQISEQWGAFIEQYGYTDPEAEPVEASSPASN